MALKLRIGLDAITSYRRLAYTPWHAIAEFVDNSTQSYFDNKEMLDRAYENEGTSLWVRIAYEQANDFIRISDNSIGMSYDELEHALHVAQPPTNTSGRSKYGMGLKTAACWIGNHWVVRTKKLGTTVEHQATIDVDAIANGTGEIPYLAIEGKRAEDHYTIIEITRHNRKFQGRTLGKIKEFLSSMYREDFRRAILDLEWQGVPLKWEEPELLTARDSTSYKKSFAFTVDDKRVEGWVGILANGSRADAGFSIIHAGRVVRGWPDSWRPRSLYGQLQGSNDLINQRLVGEIYLDAFEVSHTKDDILWLGNQEELVEDELRKHCADYRNAAKNYRVRQDDERGPTETETQVAVDELKKELESSEMVDAVSIEDVVPPEQVVEASIKQLAETVTTRAETFRANIAGRVVKGYLAGDLSPNDPYVALDTTNSTTVVIIVNTSHPHWLRLTPYPESRSGW